VNVGVESFRWEEFSSGQRLLSETGPRLTAGIKNSVATGNRASQPQRFFERDAEPHNSPADQGAASADLHSENTVSAIELCRNIWASVSRELVTDNAKTRLISCSQAD